MSLEMTNECAICCEKITMVVMREIACPMCSKKCCVKCFTRHLFDKFVPECMFCNKELSEDFIYNLGCTKKFYNEYMNKKIETLLSTEKSLIPETLEKHAMAEKLKTLREKRTFVQNIVDECNRHHKFVSEFITEEKVKFLQTQLIIVLEKIESLNVELYNKKGKDEVVVRMRCPSDKCKGYINNRNYKCSICEVYWCKKCHREKVEDHECSKEDVETVEFLLKETRPCPKCGIRISKIDGCDMMFCVNPSCLTPFSWNTGQIITNERIHNPEYFRYLRDNNMNIPRVEENVRCGANRVMPYSIPSYRSKTRGDDVRLLHRILDRLIQYEHERNVIRREVNINPETNRTQRLVYLKKTEEEWESYMKKHLKKLLLKSQIFNLYDMFINASLDFIEIFRSDSDLHKFIMSVFNLTEYTNEQIMNINGRYNSKDKRYMIDIPAITEYMNNINNAQNNDLVSMMTEMKI